MAAVKGISTYQTYLMYRTTTNGEYAKLIDITSFPDIVPPSERIDITTLSDYMRVYINGVRDTAEQQYGANYTVENFAKINKLEGEQHYYSLWFGASGSNGGEDPDGHFGKFAWTGDISAGVSGGGVNEAVKMTVTCTPATPIIFTTATSKTAPLTLEST